MSGPYHTGMGRTSIEAGTDRGRGKSSRLAETLHVHPRQGKGQRNLLEVPRRSSNSTVGCPLEVWPTPGVLPTRSLTLGCSPLSSQSPFLLAASRWVAVGPGRFPPFCSIADCTHWALVIWAQQVFCSVPGTEGLPVCRGGRKGLSGTPPVVQKNTEPALSLANGHYVP